MPRASSTGVPGLELVATGRHAGRFRLHVRQVDNASGRTREVCRLLAPKTTKTDARQALRKLEAELAGGTFKAKRVTSGALAAAAAARTPTSATTLREGLDVYLAWAKLNRPKTIRTRTSLGRTWIDTVGNVKLVDVGPELVKRFQAERSAEGAAGPTINRGVAMMKHMLGLAVDEAWSWPIDPVKVAQVIRIRMRRENPTVERFLSDDERVRVVWKAGAELRPYVVLALETGMRLGEIVALRRADVDLTRGELRIATSKNGKPRVLPISAALAPVLRAALAQSAEDALLAHPDAPVPDDAVFPWRVSGNAVTKAWVRLRKRAELPDQGFRFHDLRHDFATRKLRAGAPVHLISRFLGHSDISITLRRYAHIVTDDLRLVINLPDAAPMARVG